MNEMDLLTRLRAEVPAEVSPRAADRFHAAFAAERSTGPQRATPAAPRWWRDSPSRLSLPRLSLPRLSLSRLALATGLAAAVAAGIVVAVPRSAANRPAPVNRPATQAAPITVQELAYRAAAAALAGPSVTPGQWVYTRGGHFTNCPKDAGASASKGSAGKWSCGWTDQPELWQTADFTRWAYYDDHGRLRIQNSPKDPAQITYARVLKFPASPQALVKYVYDWQSRIETVTPPDAVPELRLATFLAITDLIKDYALPPRVGAELFRALPYVPGVRVMQAPGLVGFTWVGFTSVSRRFGRPETSETIVLNPSTYAVTGVAAVSASGKILAIMEVPTKIPVSGPGVRP